MVAEQPMSGKDFVYLLQSVDAVEGDDAMVPAFQTEGSYSSENELMDEQTKFGRVLAYGNDTESIELTYYYKRGDEGQNVAKNAKKDKKELKAWRVDTKENSSAEYDAIFAYALVESIEESDASDGFVEVSATLQIIGAAQEGTLTTLPDGAAEAAQYEFEQPGETGTTAP